MKPRAKYVERYCRQEPRSDGPMLTLDQPAPVDLVLEFQRLKSAATGAGFWLNEIRQRDGSTAYTLVTDHGPQHLKDLPAVAAHLQARAGAGR